MRLWLYLTLVVNSIILLAFIGYGGYTASEQTASLTKDLENDTRTMARSISAGSADDLLLASFDKIENLLLRQVTLGSVRELVVADSNGRILVQVERGSNDQPRVVYEHVSQPLDLSQSEVRTLATYTLLFPIERGERLGWVRVTASLSALETVRREIWVDALLASLLTIVVTGGLLGVFLRKATAALGHASKFAGDLIRQRGISMPTSSGIVEIQQLSVALNSASQALATQFLALRASELHLRQITNAVPALIADLDMEQRFRFHNKAYEEIFGLSFEEINGHTLAEVLGPQAYESVQDKVEEVLRGYPVSYERALTTPQGGLRDYAMNFLPRYGEGADEGKVIGYFSLGTDITELKRIDRMKTEFISTVSHELRTPLTSIRGSLGLIAGGVAGELPEAAKKLVGIANNNCERLIRLINDILDVEKIESGQMRLNPQVVDIKQLVQQALAANEGFAGQHRVTVLLQAPDEPLPVRIDSDCLTQVLTNLLSNAVKFSPPEGAVEVRVSRVAQQVRVEVADHGPGIPEEFRSRIFQKFSQADSSDTRQKGGTGLGLNISRALVEQMGGQIGFSSEAGAGTTFFFEIPEWQNQPCPTWYGPERRQEPKRRQEPERRQSFRAQAASSRPCILILEDDPDVARLISMMLDNAGFETEMTYSAAQALACLARKSYDAVTVDLKLPGPSGAAFISALRGDERTSHLPVVVISAMAEEGRLQLNQKPQTVSDWLEKPIDENRLILSVRRAVTGVKSGKPCVLHVEDDPDIQRIVAAIAADFAHFEFAATLDQARARLREQRFDLVLLDLALGQDSGWDLFEDINALDPRPPVIVFSASAADPPDGKQTEAVLLKTYTSNAELLHTIQRALQISGAPGPTRPKP